MEELNSYLSSSSNQTSDTESVQSKKSKVPAAKTIVHVSYSGTKTKPTVQSSGSEDEGMRGVTTTSSAQRSQSAQSTTSKVSAKTTGTANFEKYRFIPMRLSEEERNMLNVLLNALEVCEYTDVVDVTFSHTRKSKMSRIIESLVDILSISSGLMVSNNLVEGEKLLMGKTLNDNVPFFTDLFEVSFLPPSISVTSLNPCSLFV
jgi:hypothetical protein